VGQGRRLRLAGNVTAGPGRLYPRVPPCHYGHVCRTGIARLPGSGVFLLRQAALPGTEAERVQSSRTPDRVCGAVTAGMCQATCQAGVRPQPRTRYDRTTRPVFPKFAQGRTGSLTMIGCESRRDDGEACHAATLAKGRALAEINPISTYQPRRGRRAWKIRCLYRWRGFSPAPPIPRARYGLRTGADRQCAPRRRGSKRISGQNL
jgi:hypothetical protein